MGALSPPGAWEKARYDCESVVCVCVSYTSDICRILRTLSFLWQRLTRRRCVRKSVLVCLFVCCSLVYLCVQDIVCRALFSDAGQEQKFSVESLMKMSSCLASYIGSLTAVKSIGSEAIRTRLLGKFSNASDGA